MLTIAKCRDLDYYEREVIEGREEYLSEDGSRSRPMGRPPRRRRRTQRRRRPRAAQPRPSPASTPTASR